jgi:dTDP-glucose pyrophosphorylase/CBS domain-containing protein
MKNITVESIITIIQAMEQLDKSAQKCLLITDKENHLLGTLTDGDIRRAILRGASFSSDISKIYNKNPITLKSKTITNDELKKVFLNNYIDLVPVVNKENILTGIKTWAGVFGIENERKLKSINVPVVIMAGGKGSRLEPFTKILPKPLIPVNEKPIIEHIIQRFTDIGCDDFYLTVNYKARILKAYFEELSPNYTVSFIDEPEPLGTAGSLKFLKGKISKPFFVTNCDIIIKSDYKELYDYHVTNNYDLTLVAATKEYTIPYGTCVLNDNGTLSHVNEKPKYDFLINTGLYILNPDILGLIPKNNFFHITHLIDKLKNMEKKVGIFPINDERWIDVGQWHELNKAESLL